MFNMFFPSNRFLKYTFHCVQLFRLPVFYKINFAKTSLSQQFYNLKVIKVEFLLDCYTFTLDFVVLVWLIALQGNSIRIGVSIPITKGRPTLNDLVLFLVLVPENGTCRVSISP